MIIEWKKKRTKIRENFIVYQLSQKEAQRFLLHSVNHREKIGINKKVNIIYKKSMSFEKNLQEVKSILYSINSKSQQLKNNKKNWMFQFHIGRTVTRF